MRWKPGKYQVTLEDWLGKEAFAEPDRVSDDIHFDNLIGPWTNACDGVDLVARSCELLRQVVAAVPAHDNLHGVHHAIVALPLRLSEAIRPWKPRYWLKAGMRHHPPSLVLTKNDRFDEHFDEEYRRRVELPVGGFPDVMSVYKSYRDLSGPGALDVGNMIFLVSTCVGGNTLLY